MKSLCRWDQSGHFSYGRKHTEGLRWLPLFPPCQRQWQCVNIHSGFGVWSNYSVRYEWISQKYTDCRRLFFNSSRNTGSYISHNANSIFHETLLASQILNCFKPLTNADFLLNILTSTDLVLLHLAWQGILFHAKRYHMYFHCKDFLYIYLVYCGVSMYYTVYI